MIALVGAEGKARVFPLGRVDDPLTPGGFPLDVARVEDLSRTITLLDALARLAKPEQGFAPADVPCPWIGDGPLDRLTLLSQLVVPSCAREKIDPKRLQDVWETPGADADDGALARLIYVERFPTASDVRPQLEWLRQNAPARYRAVATLKLARADCDDGLLVEATAALRALSKESSACFEVALAEVAACILFAAAPGEAVDPDVRKMEQTPVAARDECPSELRARVLARRAAYRSRGAATPGDSTSIEQLARALGASR